MTYQHEDGNGLGIEELDITLDVNGETASSTVPVRMLLSDFLRDELGLRGVRVGCEHGVCGACTVVLDGAAVRSCILLAVQADGADVTTIEGLTPDTGLGVLQQAFSDNDGLQCGFCTSGFIVTLSSLDPDDFPGDGGILEAISGNLCRCTGYRGIVDAVRSAWGR
ncbi:MAG: (2Fe-2S)-binding protein [bacterium]|nr:(2Fe-2S)-binding protein [bacterium]MDE0289714.1 (2Fe-2S)-binding protein [bacterium]MDE0440169.1 (2Fe-2S)-binding protein [bacterium]